MPVDAPARNCPYRDADGRLRFSTYQTELFDVLGYPIRRDGKLFVAARSYVASEYADGWMTNYPIRDNVDGRLFAVQPTGVPLADCWPNTITMTWTGDIGIHYDVTPFVPSPVATIRELFEEEYTLTKVDFASTPFHSYVRYECVLTGNKDQGAENAYWDAVVSDAGIDYEIRLFLEFEYKAGGVTASIVGEGGTDSWTDPSSVIAYGYTCSIEIPDNPSAVADFTGVGTFCTGEYSDPVLGQGPFVQYTDGHFEDETICGSIAVWSSTEVALDPPTGWDEWYWYVFGGLRFEDTCTDLLDYLITNDFVAASSLERQVSGAVQYTSITCQFIGASYA